jgi:hypothetical protein
MLNSESEFNLYTTKELTDSGWVKRKIDEMFVEYTADDVIDEYFKTECYNMKATEFESELDLLWTEEKTIGQFIQDIKLSIIKICLNQKLVKQIKIFKLLK